MFDWLLQAGGLATQVADSLSKARQPLLGPKRDASLGHTQIRWSIDVPFRVDVYRGGIFFF